MFWCVSYHFGTIGIVWLPYELGGKWAELVQKFVPRSRIGIFRNEHSRSSPFESKLMFGTFRTIWVHLGPFGCITKLVTKQAELMQKFVPRSHVGMVRNERTRSTPLDPKLMFWCVSYHLGAFGTIMLPYETQGKTFRTSVKVRNVLPCVS